MASATNHKALEWDDRYARERDEPAGLESYTLVIRDLLLQSKQIVRDLAIRDGKVLDVAGGTGKHLKFFGLEQQGNGLFLVDFSDEAVAAARLKGIQAERCDLERERIPYDDESFDLALAQEIVEHLPDCEHLLRESYRVLKKGGYFYLTTPNLAGLIDRSFLLRGKKPLGAGRYATGRRNTCSRGCWKNSCRQGYSNVPSMVSTCRWRAGCGRNCARLDAGYLVQRDFLSLR